jgi:hypothetical protein
MDRQYNDHRKNYKRTDNTMTTGKSTKDRQYNDQMKSYKRTENAMTKGKATIGQAVICKTLNRKLKITQISLKTSSSSSFNQRPSINEG